MARQQGEQQRLEAGAELAALANAPRVAEPSRVSPHLRKCQTTAAGAHKGAWAVGSAVAFMLLATIAVFCAGMALVPRRTGPAASLLFFCRIADMNSADYTAAFERATASELLTDWTAQIHRNAEIARAKHSWAGKALMVSFMSALPWVSAVVLHLRSDEGLAKGHPRGDQGEGAGLPLRGDRVAPVDRPTAAPSAAADGDGAQSSARMVAESGLFFECQRTMR